MSNKNLTIGVVIAILIAVGGYFFPQVHALFGGIQSGTDISTTNFTTLSVQNGESNGGLYTTAARITMAQGTTTVCAIQSPNATSTLTEASALFTTSSTTGSTVTLAKATTAFATTTSLGSASIAAGAQGTVIASSTPSSVALDPAQVFSPNTWFVVGMAGNTGTFSPVGVCTIEFQVMQ